VRRSAIRSRNLNGERSMTPVAWTFGPGPSFSAQLPVYLPEKEPTMFITFKDLAGVTWWGFVLTFLLVLLGFFPIAVLLGVGAIFLATLWMASQ
jgi:hypothetical protein